MNGCNVLHAMGYDAFGLPAEQYAVQTGQHPRVTTEQNIATMKRQLRALGLAHDPRRGPATTDASLLPLDAVDLPADLQLLVRRRRRTGPGRSPSWSTSSAVGTRRDARQTSPFDDLGAARAARARRRATGSRTSPRRRSTGARVSARCSPTKRSPPTAAASAATSRCTGGRCKQWMLRITAYADRLLDDLDDARLVRLDQADAAQLDRPQHRRERHASRSRAARTSTIEVFTTRPDTIFGATYMVLAPEHPLVDEITAIEWPGDDVFVDWESNPIDAWKGVFGMTGTPADAVLRYREFAAAKSDLERQADTQATRPACSPAAFVINPTNDQQIPVFIADYVLMGYGTGAIMAVPGQDERDWEFAETFDLPIVRTVQPPDDFEGDGVPRRRAGDQQRLPRRPARRRGEGSDHRVARGERLGRTAASPTSCATGCSAGSATGASRSRSSTTTYGPVALPDAMLPVELPEITDFEPDDLRRSRRAARTAARARVRLGRGRARSRRAGVGRLRPRPAGRTCARRTRCRSGPARVGTTCATSTRPTRTRWSIPVVEQAWAAGTRADGAPKTGLVDLYVGGVEHGCCTCCTRGSGTRCCTTSAYVSTPEPFQRLVNQGYILAPAYTDERGMYVEASEVEERDGEFFHDGAPVTREFGKMGKSLKNAVAPDDIYRDYGADTLRLYEMFMGPLDASRPWNTADIIGVHRFLQRLWRNVVDEETGRRACRRRARRRRDAAAAAPHDRGGARRHGDDGLQHRDRAAVRAQQPPDAGRAGAGRAPREVVDAAGADGRAARAARRRGAVGAHSGTPTRSRTSRSRPPTPRCSSPTQVEVPVQIERQGAQPHHGAGRGRRRDARSAWPAPTRRIAELLDGATRAQGRSSYPAGSSTSSSEPPRLVVCGDFSRHFPSVVHRVPGSRRLPCRIPTFPRVRPRPNPCRCSIACSSCAPTRVSAVALVALAVVAGVVVWVRTSVARRCHRRPPTQPRTGRPSPPPRTRRRRRPHRHARADSWCTSSARCSRRGVVELDAGARVRDAVVAAGGAADDADLQRLNLAAPVTDGERIAVPRIGEPDPAPVAGENPGGTVPAAPKCPPGR